MSSKNPNTASQSNVIKIISGSRGKFPIKLGIGSGQLAVTIYLHEEFSVAGKIACWSYLTEGLTRFQQKECLLTLRVNQEENVNKFPMQPLHFFNLLLKQASQKNIVDIGDTIKLGSKGLFGFAGAGFVFPLTNPSKVPFKRPTLSCILLTESETMTAQQHGLSRIIARMGYEQDQYPCLPWIVRGRQGLAINDVTRLTVLNENPKIPMKHTAAYMEDGETIVLNIPKRMRSFLLKADESKKLNAICLLTQILPGNDGCMTWLPHKDSSQIITASDAAGEFIAGCFLLIKQSQEFNGAAMLEDGFEMNVTNNAWHAIKTAMVGNERILIPGEKGNMNFQLICSDKKSDMEKPFVKTRAGFSEDTEEGGLFGKLFGRFKK